VEENTNINVVEETEENYLQLSEYAEAQVNVLDEVPQSYSHQGNPKWIKQSIQPKNKIMNLWIRRCSYYFQGFMHFVKKKDMRSWIVFLCLFTSKQILLDMWRYKM
jgi:hypothetical protein